MKAPDMRPLIGQQNQAHKAHIDNKDTRRELGAARFRLVEPPIAACALFRAAGQSYKNTVNPFMRGQLLFYEAACSHEL
jgi:hypothetical protein